MRSYLSFFLFFFLFFVEEGGGEVIKIEGRSFWRRRLIEEGEEKRLKKLMF